MQAVGLLGRPVLAEQQQPWLDVSATECTASAIIDDDPVIRKPMNLAVAIPAFASSAAMIALGSLCGHVSPGCGDGAAGRAPDRQRGGPHATLTEPHGAQLGQR